MKTAALITSTPGEKLVQTRLSPAPETSGHPLTLTGRRCQTIDGFGGCFNELGWRTLSRLPEQERQEILRNLFAPEESHFTYCRLPIGASDYAESWYSLNETEGDYAMEHFTIERDKHCLIPYIQSAMAYSGKLTLFASPWSPPIWMKNPRAYNFGTLIWTEENLRAYALYFKKFVEAYTAEGIAIDQVHIQNEPISDQKFPSCLWTGEQLRDFIRDYIGPLFREAGLSTEIWLGTINAPYDNYGHMPAWHTSNYNKMVNPVLSDHAARDYISGVGFQWGGKHAIQQTHTAYPDMKLAQTENECGDGRNGWDYAEYTFSLIWHFLHNGAGAYTYWNMVLDEGGVSTWGWRQNSLITVDDALAVHYQPEYYVMGHFSRYVQPGAVLLELSGDYAANALAFENPDGSTVLVIHNPFDQETQVDFLGFRADLKPHSFHTLVVE